MPKPIEKQVNEAINKWMQSTELMLRKILAKIGIFNPLTANMEVKILENNVKEYYIDDELVMTTSIVIKKHNITFRVDPAEKYKDI